MAFQKVYSQKCISAQEDSEYIVSLMTGSKLDFLATLHL